MEQAVADPETLRCTSCGWSTSIASMPSTCARCDGIVDVIYREADGYPGAGGDRRAGETGIWLWSAFLPYCAPRHRVSLGEAHSPLLKCDRLAERLGLSSFWIKNDSIMPTGSFKDRAMALTVSLALQYERDGLVLSSSGNAGASAAAYAARAGLAVKVLVPAHTPEAKLRQIAICGAELITVEGTTSDTCRMVQRLAREHRLTNVTTTFHNPYGVEAYATIAYETADIEADVVLMPIASGPLLAGMMKGYGRMKAQGLIAKVPRPVAVQARNCAPIVRAFNENTTVGAWAHQPSIASALNDTLAGYERDGDYTLDWIRAFGGCAVAVGEEAIADAARKLAATEGLVVEPSAAVTIGAIGDMLANGTIAPDETVLVVATGHGLKDLSCAQV